MKRRSFPIVRRVLTDGIIGKWLTAHGGVQAELWDVSVIADLTEAVITYKTEDELLTYWQLAFALMGLADIVDCRLSDEADDNRVWEYAIVARFGPISER